jgi:hypothetical protein
METSEVGETVAHKSILLIVVKRFAILLFAVAFSALFFWTIGNFRRFLDETELILLDILRWSSLLLLPVSALGVGVTFAIKSGRDAVHRLEGFLGYLFLLLFACAGAFLSELLSLLASGLK